MKPSWLRHNISKHLFDGIVGVISKSKRLPNITSCFVGCHIMLLKAGLSGISDQSGLALTVVTSGGERIAKNVSRFGFTKESASIATPLLVLFKSCIFV